jgi:RNA polymerase sigma-70 factor (ECF subfamily)
VKDQPDRESEKDHTMNWQDAIPSVATAQAAPVVEPAMDSDRFAAFYQRSSRPLWAYLARASGDPALADDLMQESYVRFLTANSPPDGEVAARMYLFRIASNLLRDHWRRPRTTSIDDLPPDNTDARSATLSRPPDASAQTDARLTLSPALAQLRPRDRQLLWLAHAENYSHREIAQITGLAAPSIRLLLFRARRHMANLLQKEGARLP